MRNLKCSNYRLICLLSNLDKVLEGIMNNRLQTFLKKTIHFKLHPPIFQFSFRQKHSYTHALGHLTERNRTLLDNGNYGCGIFVDSQNAFDTRS